MTGHPRGSVEILSALGELSAADIIEQKKKNPLKWCKDETNI